MSFNWTCPHCNHAQTVIEERRKAQHSHIALSNLAEGPVGYSTLAIGCANTECKRLTLTFMVHNDQHIAGSGWSRVGGTKALFSARILPAGDAKPQPDFIPAPLRDDYVEACKIRDLSAKASATLVRRCLQGMIRDFSGINRRTLAEEIKALRVAVDTHEAPEGITHDSIDAIDAVRSVGNIGAHMERDIDLIIDVEPEEAQLLIELVELLFAEWYVARHNRQKRLAAISALAAQKQAARTPVPLDAGAAQSSVAQE